MSSPPAGESATKQVLSRATLLIDRQPILYIVVFAVAVQILFRLSLPGSYRENESTDYLVFYEPVAESILSGDGLRTPDGSPAVRYPPGYPALLAVIYKGASVVGLDRDAAVTSFVILTMAGAAVVVFLIGRELLDPRLGLVASALWMTYPINLWLAKQPNSEVPFVLVMYGAILLLIRSLRERQGLLGRFFAVGLLVGFASLIRPIAILLVLPLAGVTYLWLRRERLRLRLILCGLLIAGNLVAVAPWEVWAFSETGKLIPLSSGDQAALLAGLTQRTDREYEKAVPHDVRALMRRARAQRDSLSGADDIAAFLWRETRAHPMTVAKLMALKAVGPWYITFSGRLDIFIALAQILYLSLAGVGAVAAWRSGARERDGLILILCVVLYFWAIAFATAPRVRFMAAALGLLLILAARSFAPLVRRVEQRGSAPGQLTTAAPM